MKGTHKELSKAVSRNARASCVPLATCGSSTERDCLQVHCRQSGGIELHLPQYGCSSFYLELLDVVSRKITVMIFMENFSVISSCNLTLRWCFIYYFIILLWFFFLNYCFLHMELYEILLLHYNESRKWSLKQAFWWLKSKLDELWWKSS